MEMNASSPTLALVARGTEDTGKKHKSPPSLLRWNKKRYENDEEYKQKQKEKSRLQYEKNREKIRERYKTDEEYRRYIIDGVLKAKAKRMEREREAKKKAEA